MRRSISMICAVVLAAAVMAGCGGVSGGYWDQSDEFDNVPMFDKNGDNVKKQISEALHKELVKCGADEDHVANQIASGDLRSGAFYVVDTEGGVDPSDLREGSAAGWLITTPNPMPVEHPSKIEVHCKRRSEPPDFLR